MKYINVGLIGSGFSAALHCEAYKRVYGVDVRLKSIASTSNGVDEFAQKYGIKTIYKDHVDLLNDEDIDVVDICTPTYLHHDMVIDALLHDKHVICEKPFIGYFDKMKIGDRKTLNHILERMNKVRDILTKTNRKFMYAENWVYAPDISKIAEVIRKRKDKILYMKGEESHSGSHASHATSWSKTGGGALIRMGCHPLTAILYLKRIEAETRNEKIVVKSVLGDTGVLTKALCEDELSYIKARPIDVEDWGSALITFSDGTKASIIAGDMILGGVRNNMEIYCNDGIMMCSITPNNKLLGYFPDEKNLDDLYITEKIETKKGWQFFCTDEEYVRGYINELQDFMECVLYNREPISDFELAYETIKVIYGAYNSAHEGRKFEFI
ncbi:Gfo/Idh/MocA family protein [Paramaledivibacter caminithermalis]|jgi:predicted dehydrogenase|uniref:Predicted dehydrogenase n=1 Tax=Paramaledivibacter caminithermalis (strain DSM 15212 / CIP 107654 / DViRD3) TaxID=1121301 RepID=A0A1M6NT77_PARC5|nr:Gfo/Idh/MocA family oxidoreductase [Paramaledivibacter caminithermalis]SHJ98838.1 Predicted dehydrogenase [Paramaledivibacter caminithermalis DSM 15212]